MGAEKYEKIRPPGTMGFGSGGDFGTADFISLEEGEIAENTMEFACP
jgi:hypothetical protein